MKKFDLREDKGIKRAFDDMIEDMRKLLFDKKKEINSKDDRVYLTNNSLTKKLDLNLPNHMKKSAFDKNKKVSINQIYELQQNLNLPESNKFRIHYYQTQISMLYGLVQSKVTEIKKNNMQNEIEN